MRNKLSILLIIVLVFAVAMTTSAQDGIAAGDVVEAEADDANVTYTLSVEAGQAVLIDLVTDDWSSKLELSDGAGTIVAADEDSGDDFNDSRIVYMSPEGGDYVLTVGASFGEADGSYTLSVTSLDLPVIEYGGSVDVEAAGLTRFYFAFNASAGDVVNIYANAISDDDDVELTVRSLMGEEVGSDSDNGPGTDPYIRRMVIPADGMYNIFGESWFDDEMVGNFTIFVEQTESLPITADAYTVTLGDTFDMEVFTLEASSGSSYALTVSAANADTTIDVLENGDTFADIRMTASSYNEVTFVFTTVATGTAFINVDNTTWNEAVDYTISIVPVE